MSAEPSTDGARRTALRRAARLAALLCIAAFIALLVYGLVLKSPETGIDEGLARAQPVAAPGFELPILARGSLGRPLAARLSPALADGRVALDELRGTPVVLNLWASWCVPCRQEAPLLERTWRAARRDGVLFVGLNQQDLTDDARAFMREFRVSYPNLRDPTNRTARKWGATGLPETFFVTGEGQVVGHVIGVVSPEQLRDGVRASRSGRPVGARSGGDRLTR